LKSKQVNNKFYIECACESSAHLLVFEYQEDTNSIDVFTTQNLLETNIFKRIEFAIRYIFNPNKYELSTTIILNRENIKCLEEVTKYLKRKNKKGLKK